MRRQTRANLESSVTAISPDLALVMGAACAASGSDQPGQSAVSAGQMVRLRGCQLSVLQGIHSNAAQAAGVGPGDFDHVMGDPANLHPPAWFVLVYQKTCVKQGTPGFDCFQQHMKQVRNDVASAYPAFDRYFTQLNRAGLLSQLYCKVNSERCQAAGLHAHDVWIDPQEKDAQGNPVPVPHYFARKSAAPAQDHSGLGSSANGSGVSGSGGKGNSGQGTGGGGTAERSFGPGNGQSRGLNAGQGNGPNPGTAAGQGGSAAGGQGTVGNHTGGKAGGTADQTVNGAADGAHGGTQNCGTDERGNPIDCNTQTLIAPKDIGWEVEGPMAQCPTFLQPYNCLGIGSGLAGDLSKVKGAPSLTREQIDTARVSGSGKLYDQLMNLADFVSKNGLQRDLGAYSIEQKALAVFQVEANLNPAILTSSDSTAFNNFVKTLLGASDKCLNVDDKNQLRQQLAFARLQGVLNTKSIQAMKGTLDQKWVDDLSAKAEKTTQLDRANFDVSHLWSRLRCDQSYSGDSFQCLKYDYDTIGNHGQAVSQQVYDTRLRWIRDELNQALAKPDQTEQPDWGAILHPGRGANEDPSCTYVSCSDLTRAVHVLRAGENEEFSNNALLGEKTGGTETQLACGSDPAERDPARVRWSQTSSMLKADPDAAMGSAWVASLIGADETACQRPQTLADKLHDTQRPDLRLAAARAAAAKMRDEGLKGIKNVCSKPDGVIEEGKHASGVQQLAQGFLSCQDIGEYSKECADRRSYGWAMCRSFMQNTSDSNSEQYRQMFIGMAMAAGGGFALMATAGGAAVIAGALGLGMSGSSIAMRHIEISDSTDNYAKARADLLAGVGDYNQTASAWSRMNDATKHAMAGDVFDGLSSVMDIGALAHAAQTRRLVGQVAAVDELLSQGNGAQALAKASRLKTAEETLNEARRAGIVQGVDAHVEILESMRADLRSYGPRVEAMPESEVATLHNLDSRLKTLIKEGMIDESTVTQVRREISDALVSPEKLASLSNKEAGQLYYEMRAGGRFAGADGRKLEDRFLEIYDGMLRAQHPEITDAVWTTVSRDEKLAMLEGHLTSAEVQARHLADVAKSASKTAESASEAKSAHAVLITQVNESPEMDALRERHKVFSAISTGDNYRYISIANKPGGIGKLYFEVENAVLKQLNDTVIGNKDTVTALGNQYKEILFRNIENNPLLRSKLTAQYSDFKSLRLIFTENSPEVVNELKKVYQESGKEFERIMDGSPLRDLFKDAHGINGKPASWHLAGIGSSADEASVAARSARSYFRPGLAVTDLRIFATSTGMLADRLGSIEDLRGDLQKEFGSAKGMLVPAVPGSPRLVLSKDGFEILRKIKASDLNEYMTQVKDRFRTRFGVELTNDQVINIRDYATLVDGYSASITVAEREVIDMSKASKFGAMSFDLAGAGAHNLERTAGELAADVGGTPGSAVKGARRAEQHVTDVMGRKYDVIKKAVKDVLGERALQNLKKTGDDVMLLPDEAVTAAQREEIQARVSKGLSESGDGPDSVRTTTQPPKFEGGGVIPAGTRSTYIVAAEGVEKGLRISLEGRVGLERLRQIGIMVDYAPAADGKGIMNIIVTGKTDPQLLAQIRAQAQTLVPEGVEFQSVRTVGGIPSAAAVSQPLPIAQPAAAE